MAYSGLYHNSPYAIASVFFWQVQKLKPDEKNHLYAENLLKIAGDLSRQHEQQGRFFVND